MLETEFTCEGMKTIIQCKENDNVKDICNKFCVKTGKEIDKSLFLYEGEKINLEKKIKDMITNKNENQNKLSILVSDTLVKKKINSIENSKQVICPECEQKSIRFKLKNYHISLFECDNRHKLLGINADEYLKNQKVDLAKIICNECKTKNKNESFQKKFFKCCQCAQILCPLCKESSHKSHKIINYDDKCFICEEDGEYYTKYCNECKKNVCRICDGNHKSHNMTYFMDIMPNKKIIVDSLIELKDKINQFEKDIENIKKLFDKMLNNLEVNYEILKKISDEYEENNDKKRNYQILQNMNDIKTFSSSIICDINKVINNSDLMDKMKYIVDMHYKM